MLTLNQFFKSKTIWVLGATFLFNGIQSIHPIVGADTASKINGLLAMVAAGARATNTQGATGTTTVISTGPNKIN